jgi:hypothetical protein
MPAGPTRGGPIAEVQSIDPQAKNDAGVQLRAQRQAAKESAHAEKHRAG